VGIKRTRGREREVRESWSGKKGMKARLRKRDGGRKEEKQREKDIDRVREREGT
jgi:hypothetical protein